MAYIAPIPVPSQPPQQTIQSTPASNNGDDTSFGTILNKTVASTEGTTAQERSNTGEPQSDNQTATAEHNQGAIAQEPANQEPGSVQDSSLSQQAEASKKNGDTVINRAAQDFRHSAMELKAVGLTNQIHDIPVQSKAQLAHTNIFQQQIGNTELLAAVGNNNASQRFATPPATTTPNEAVAGVLATLAQTNTGQINTLTPSEPIITAQLQQLIDNNEKGTITVTQQSGNSVTLRSLNNLQPLHSSVEATPGAAQQQQEVALLAATETITGKMGSPQPAVVNEQHPNKPGQSLGSLRQDVQGQFLEAKLEAQGKNAENQNPQTTQQDANGNPQSALSNTQTAGSRFDSDQNATFSQINQAALDNKLNQPATEAARPVVLPSGTSVSEEAVIHQVAERFYLHTGTQATKLVVRLHPAELGELKIDLTMKEGSIRANVVAQSQHVQEILEKNMPRLRAILENQGLFLEEIQVSSESDSVNDFNLFKEQLSQGKEQHASPSQNLDTASFSQTLESAASIDQTPTNGVNVTV